MKKIFIIFSLMLLVVQSYALEVVKIETSEVLDPETSEVISSSTSTVFQPDVLISPITTAIITTICSVAGIFLIVIGCRWVFRLCRGGR